MSPWTKSVAIVVLLVAAPPCAAAEETAPSAPASQPQTRPARTDARSLARDAYLSAREHYEAGRYAEAVAELKRAHAIKPFSVLLRYIADAYFEMKRYRLALDYYRRYLDRARYAPDKAQVGQRVRELEESLSTDEGGPAPGQARTKLPAELIPDGRDAEVPADLMPKPPPPPAHVRSDGGAPPERPRSTREKILIAAKWSALGVSVATFAVGLTYNLLARSKARELEENVRTACPPAQPDCGGNPGLNRPVVGFTLEQYELEQTVERYQNRSIGFFVGAGAAAAAAVVLFVIDRPRPRQVSVVPLSGPGLFALAGEARF